MVQESSYYDIVRRSEVKEESRKLRRLFLRYKEAEVVYSPKVVKAVLKLV